MLSIKKQQQTKNKRLIAFILAFIMLSEFLPIGNVFAMPAYNAPLQEILEITPEIIEPETPTNVEPEPPTEPEPAEPTEPPTEEPEPPTELEPPPTEPDGGNENEPEPPTEPPTGEPEEPTEPPTGEPEPEEPTEPEPPTEPSEPEEPTEPEPPTGDLEPEEPAETNPPTEELEPEEPTEPPTDDLDPEDSTEPDPPTEEPEPDEEDETDEPEDLEDPSDPEDFPDLDTLFPLTPEIDFDEDGNPIVIHPELPPDWNNETPELETPEHPEPPDIGDLLPDLPPLEIEAIPIAALFDGTLDITLQPRTESDRGIRTQTFLDIGINANWSALSLEPTQHLSDSEIFWIENQLLYNWTLTEWERDSLLDRLAFTRTFTEHETAQILNSAEVRDLRIEIPIPDGFVNREITIVNVRAVQPDMIFDFPIDWDWEQPNPQSLVITAPTISAGDNFFFVVEFGLVGEELDGVLGAQLDITATYQIPGEIAIDPEDGTTTETWEPRQFNGSAQINFFARNPPNIDAPPLNVTMNFNSEPSPELPPNARLFRTGESDNQINVSVSFAGGVTAGAAEGVSIWLHLPYINPNPTENPDGSINWESETYTGYGLQLNAILGEGWVVAPGTELPARGWVEIIRIPPPGAVAAATSPGFNAPLTFYAPQGGRVPENAEVHVTTWVSYELYHRGLIGGVVQELSPPWETPNRRAEWSIPIPDSIEWLQIDHLIVINTNLAWETELVALEPQTTVWDRLNYVPFQLTIRNTSENEESIIQRFGVALNAPTLGATNIGGVEAVDVTMWLWNDGNPPTLNRNPEDVQQQIFIGNEEFGGGVIIYEITGLPPDEPLLPESMIPYTFLGGGNMTLYFPQGTGEIHAPSALQGNRVSERQFLILVPFSNRFTQFPADLTMLATPTIFFGAGDMGWSRVAHAPFTMIAPERLGMRFEKNEEGSVFFGNEGTYSLQGFENLSNLPVISPFLVDTLPHEDEFTLHTIRYWVPGGLEYGEPARLTDWLDDVTWQPPDYWDNPPANEFETPRAGREMFQFEIERRNPETGEITLEWRDFPVPTPVAEFGLPAEQAGLPSEGYMWEIPARAVIDDFLESNNPPQIYGEPPVEPIYRFTGRLRVNFRKWWLPGDRFDGRIYIDGEFTVIGGVRNDAELFWYEISDHSDRNWHSTFPYAPQYRFDLMSELPQNIFQIPPIPPYADNAVLTVIQPDIVLTTGGLVGGAPDWLDRSHPSPTNVWFGIQNGYRFFMSNHSEARPLRHQLTVNLPIPTAGSLEEQLETGIEGFLVDTIIIPWELLEMGDLEQITLIDGLLPDNQIVFDREWLESRISNGNDLILTTEIWQPDPNEVGAVEFPSTIIFDFNRYDAEVFADDENRLFVDFLGDTMQFATLTARGEWLAFNRPGAVIDTSIAQHSLVVVRPQPTVMGAGLRPNLPPTQPSRGGTTPVNQFNPDGTSALNGYRFLLGNSEDALMFTSVFHVMFQLISAPTEDLPANGFLLQEIFIPNGILQEGEIASVRINDGFGSTTFVEFDVDDLEDFTNADGITIPATAWESADVAHPLEVFVTFAYFNAEVFPTHDNEIFIDLLGFADHYGGNVQGIATAGSLIAGVIWETFDPFRSSVAIDNTTHTLTVQPPNLNISTAGLRDVRGGEFPPHVSSGVANATVTTQVVRIGNDGDFLLNGYRFFLGNSSQAPLGRGVLTATLPQILQPTEDFAAGGFLLQQVVLPNSLLDVANPLFVQVSDDLGNVQIIDDLMRFFDPDIGIVIPQAEFGAAEFPRTVVVEFGGFFGGITNAQAIANGVFVDLLGYTNQYATLQATGVWQALTSRNVSLHSVTDRRFLEVLRPILQIVTSGVSTGTASTANPTPIGFLSPGMPGPRNGYRFNLGNNSQAPMERGIFRVTLPQIDFATVDGVLEADGFLMTDIRIPPEIFEIIQIHSISVAEFDNAANVWEIDGDSSPNLQDLINENGLLISQETAWGAAGIEFAGAVSVDFTLLHHTNPANFGNMHFLELLGFTPSFRTLTANAQFTAFEPRNETISNTTANHGLIVVRPEPTLTAAGMSAAVRPDDSPDTTPHNTGIFAATPNPTRVLYAERPQFGQPTTPLLNGYRFYLGNTAGASMLGSVFTANLPIPQAPTETHAATGFLTQQITIPSQIMFINEIVEDEEPAIYAMRLVDFFDETIYWELADEDLHALINANGDIILTPTDWAVAGIEYVGSLQLRFTSFPGNIAANNDNGRFIEFLGITNHFDRWQWNGTNAAGTQGTGGGAWTRMLNASGNWATFDHINNPVAQANASHNLSVIEPLPRVTVEARYFGDFESNMGTWNTWHTNFNNVINGGTGTNSRIPYGRFGEYRFTFTNQSQAFVPNFTATLDFQITNRNGEQPTWVPNTHLEIGGNTIGNPPDPNRNRGIKLDHLELSAGFLQNSRITMIEIFDVDNGLETPVLTLGDGSFIVNQNRIEFSSQLANYWVARVVIHADGFNANIGWNNTEHRIWARGHLDPIPYVTSPTWGGFNPQTLSFGSWGSNGEWHHNPRAMAFNRNFAGANNRARAIWAYEINQETVNRQGNAGFLVRGASIDFNMRSRVLPHGNLHNNTPQGNNPIHWNSPFGGNEWAETTVSGTDIGWTEWAQAFEFATHKTIGSFTGGFRQSAGFDAWENNVQMTVEATFNIPHLEFDSYYILIHSTLRPFVDRVDIYRGSNLTTPWQTVQGSQLPSNSRDNHSRINVALASNNTSDNTLFGTFQINAQGDPQNNAPLTAEQRRAVHPYYRSPLYWGHTLTNAVSRVVVTFSINPTDGTGTRPLDPTVLNPMLTDNPGTNWLIDVTGRIHRESGILTADTTVRYTFGNPAHDTDRPQMTPTMNLSNRRTFHGTSNGLWSGNGQQRPTISPIDPMGNPQQWTLTLPTLIEPVPGQAAFGANGPLTSSGGQTHPAQGPNQGGIQGWAGWGTAVVGGFLDRERHPSPPNMTLGGSNGNNSGPHGNTFGPHWGTSWQPSFFEVLPPGVSVRKNTHARVPAGDVSGLSPNYRYTFRDANAPNLPFLNMLTPGPQNFNFAGAGTASVPTTLPAHLEPEVGGIRSFYVGMWNRETRWQLRSETIGVGNNATQVDRSAWQIGPLVTTDRVAIQDTLPVPVLDFREDNPLIGFLPTQFDYIGRAGDFLWVDIEITLHDGTVTTHTFERADFPDQDGNLTVLVEWEFDGAPLANPDNLPLVRVPITPRTATAPSYVSRVTLFMDGIVGEGDWSREIWGFAPDDYYTQNPDILRVTGQLNNTEWGQHRSFGNNQPPGTIGVNQVQGRALGDHRGFDFDSPITLSHTDHARMRARPSLLQGWLQVHTNVNPFTTAVNPPNSTGLDAFTDFTNVSPHHTPNLVSFHYNLRNLPQVAPTNPGGDNNTIRAPIRQFDVTSGTLPVGYRLHEIEIPREIFSGVTADGENWHTNRFTINTPTQTNVDVLPFFEFVAARDAYVLNIRNLFIMGILTTPTASVHGHIAHDIRRFDMTFALWDIENRSLFLQADEPLLAGRDNIILRGFYADEPPNAAENTWDGIYSRATLPVNTTWTDFTATNVNGGIAGYSVTDTTQAAMVVHSGTRFSSPPDTNSQPATDSEVHNTTFRIFTLRAPITLAAAWSTVFDEHETTVDTPNNWVLPGNLFNVTLTYSNVGTAGNNRDIHLRNPSLRYRLQNGQAVNSALRDGVRIVSWDLDETETTANVNLVSADLLLPDNTTATITGDNWLDDLSLGMIRDIFWEFDGYMEKGETIVINLQLQITDEINAATPWPVAFQNANFLLTHSLRGGGGRIHGREYIRPSTNAGAQPAMQHGLHQLHTTRPNEQAAADNFNGVNWQSVRGGFQTFVSNTAQHPGSLYTFVSTLTPTIGIAAVDEWDGEADQISSHEALVTIGGIHNNVRHEQVRFHMDFTFDTSTTVQNHGPGLVLLEWPNVQYPNIAHDWEFSQPQIFYRTMTEGVPINLATGEGLSDWILVENQNSPVPLLPSGVHIHSIRWVYGQMSLLENVDFPNVEILVEGTYRVANPANPAATYRANMNVGTFFSHNEHIFAETTQRYFGRQNTAFYDVYAQTPWLIVYSGVYRTQADAVGFRLEEGAAGNPAQMTFYRPGDDIWYRISVENRSRNRAPTAYNRLGTGPLLYPVIFDRVPEYLVDIFPAGMTAQQAMEQGFIDVRIFDAVTGQEISDIGRVTLTTTETTGFDIAGANRVEHNAIGAPVNANQLNEQNAENISFTVFTYAFERPLGRDETIVITYRATARQENLPMLFFEQTTTGERLNPYLPRFGEYLASSWATGTGQNVTNHRTVQPDTANDRNWNANNNPFRTMDANWLIRETGVTGTPNWGTLPERFLNQSLTWIPGMAQENTVNVSGNAAWWQGGNNNLFDHDLRTELRQRTHFDSINNTMRPDRSRFSNWAGVWETNWASANSVRDLWALVVNPRVTPFRANFQNYLPAPFSENMDTSPNILWTQTRQRLASAWLYGTSQFEVDETVTNHLGAPQPMSFVDNRGNLGVQRPIATAGQNDTGRRRFATDDYTFGVEYGQVFTVHQRAINYGDWQLGGVEFIHILPRGIAPVFNASGNIDVTAMYGDPNLAIPATGAFTSEGRLPAPTGLSPIPPQYTVRAEVIQRPNDSNPAFRAPRNWVESRNADNWEFFDEPPYVVKITVNAPLAPWWNRGTLGFATDANNRQYYINTSFDVVVTHENPDGMWHDLLLTSWLENDPHAAYAQIFSRDFASGMSANIATAGNAWHDTGVFGMDMTHNQFATTEIGTAGWQTGAPGQFWTTSPLTFSVRGRNVQATQLSTSRASSLFGRGFLSTINTASYGETPNILGRTERQFAMAGDAVRARQSTPRLWTTWDDGTHPTFYSEAREQFNLNINLLNQWFLAERPINTIQGNANNHNMNNHRTNGGLQGTLFEPVISNILPFGLVPMTANGVPFPINGDFGNMQADFGVVHSQNNVNFSDFWDISVVFIENSEYTPPSVAHPQIFALNGQNGELLNGNNGNGGILGGISQNPINPQNDGLDGLDEIDETLPATVTPILPEITPPRGGHEVGRYKITLTPRDFANFADEVMLRYGEQLTATIPVFVAEWPNNIAWGEDRAFVVDQFLNEQWQQNRAFVGFKRNINFFFTEDDFPVSPYFVAATLAENVPFTPGTISPPTAANSATSGDIRHTNSITRLLTLYERDDFNIEDFVARGRPELPLYPRNRDFDGNGAASQIIEGVEIFDRFLTMNMNLFTQRPNLALYHNITPNRDDTIVHGFAPVFNYRDIFWYHLEVANRLDYSMLEQPPNLTFEQWRTLVERHGGTLSGGSVHIFDHLPHNVEILDYEIAYISPAGELVSLTSAQAAAAGWQVTIHENSTGYQVDGDYLLHAEIITASDFANTGTTHWQRRAGDLRTGESFWLRLQTQVVEVGENEGLAPNEIGTDWGVYTANAFMTAVIDTAISPTLPEDFITYSFATSENRANFDINNDGIIDRTTGIGEIIHSGAAANFTVRKPWADFRMDTNRPRTQFAGGTSTNPLYSTMQPIEVMLNEVQLFGADVPELIIVADVMSRFTYTPRTLQPEWTSEVASVQTGLWSVPEGVDESLFSVKVFYTQEMTEFGEVGDRSQWQLITEVGLRANEIVLLPTNSTAREVEKIIFVVSPRSDLPHDPNLLVPIGLQIDYEGEPSPDETDPNRFNNSVMQQSSFSAAVFRNAPRFTVVTTVFSALTQTQFSSGRLWLRYGNERYHDFRRDFVGVDVTMSEPAVDFTITQHAFAYNPPPVAGAPDFFAWTPNFEADPGLSNTLRYEMTLFNIEQDVLDASHNMAVRALTEDILINPVIVLAIPPTVGIDENLVEWDDLNRSDVGFMVAAVAGNPFFQQRHVWRWEHTRIDPTNTSYSLDFVAMHFDSIPGLGRDTLRFEFEGNMMPGDTLTVTITADITDFGAMALQRDNTVALAAGFSFSGALTHYTDPNDDTLTRPIPSGLMPDNFDWDRNGRAADRRIQHQTPPWNVAQRQDFPLHKRAITDLTRPSGITEGFAAAATEGSAISYELIISNTTLPRPAGQLYNNPVFFDVLPFFGDEGMLSENPRHSAWHGFVEPDSFRLDWITDGGATNLTDLSRIWVGPIRFNGVGNFTPLDESYIVPAALRGDVTGFYAILTSDAVFRQHNFIRVSELLAIRNTQPAQFERLVRAIRMVYAQSPPNFQLGGMESLRLSVDIRAPLNLPFLADMALASEIEIFEDYTIWNNFASRHDGMANPMESRLVGAFLQAPPNRAYIGDFVWFDVNRDGLENEAVEYYIAANGRRLPVLRGTPQETWVHGFDPGINGVLVELLTADGFLSDIDGNRIGLGGIANGERYYIILDAFGNPQIDPSSLQQMPAASPPVQYTTMSDFAGRQGYYILTNLAPNRDYRLRFTFPEEWAYHGLTTLTFHDGVELQGFGRGERLPALNNASTAPQPITDTFVVISEPFTLQLGWSDERYTNFDVGVNIPVQLQGVAWQDVGFDPLDAVDEFRNDGVRQAFEPLFAGVEVTLHNPDGTVAIDMRNRPAVAVTDENGEVWFNHLRPYETLFATVVSPNFNFRRATPFVPYANPLENTGFNDMLNMADGSLRTNHFTLNPLTDASGAYIMNGERFAPLIGLDFGFMEMERSMITGILWHDENEDGIRNATEPRLAGVEVFLRRYILNANGTYTLDSTFAERSMFTNSLGQYAFNRLEAGEYDAFGNQTIFAYSVFIRELPPGFSITAFRARPDWLDVATAEQYDSDLLTDGNMTPTRLVLAKRLDNNSGWDIETAELFTGTDAGFVAWAAGSISGVAWDDLNEDGLNDGVANGENPVQGLQMRLEARLLGDATSTFQPVRVSAAGEVLLPDNPAAGENLTTLTNEDGFYIFENLPPASIFTRLAGADGVYRWAIYEYRVYTSIENYDFVEWTILGDSQAPREVRNDTFADSLRGDRIGIMEMYRNGVLAVQNTVNVPYALELWTLTNAVNIEHQNTGLIFGQPVWIRGTVWADENADGYIGAAEERLAGVQVSLFARFMQDSTGTVDQTWREFADLFGNASILTDENGEFAFRVYPASFNLTDWANLMRMFEFRVAVDKTTAQQFSNPALLADSTIIRYQDFDDLPLRAELSQEMQISWANRGTSEIITFGEYADGFYLAGSIDYRNAVHLENAGIIPPPQALITGQVWYDEGRDGWLDDTDEWLADV
ncbi:MAG: hypothetical protein FWG68_12675, partial [Defluviitaleaceae bacterium]|nr:hypothetical protein [Defluviitaleaceae bacterium]